MDPLWAKGVGSAAGPVACGAGGAFLVGGGGIGVGNVGMGKGGPGMGGMTAMPGVGGMSVEGNSVMMGLGGVGEPGGGRGRLIEPHGMVVVEGCGAEGCEECEREMDVIDYARQDGRRDSLC